jgi:hypothetical protein
VPIMVLRQTTKGEWSGSGKMTAVAIMEKYGFQ